MIEEVRTIPRRLDVDALCDEGIPVGIIERVIAPLILEPAELIDARGLFVGDADSRRKIPEHMQARLTERIREGVDGDAVGLLKRGARVS